MTQINILHRIDAPQAAGVLQDVFGAKSGGAVELWLQTAQFRTQINILCRIDAPQAAGV